MQIANFKLTNPLFLFLVLTLLAGCDTPRIAGSAAAKNTVNSDLKKTTGVKTFSLVVIGDTQRNIDRSDPKNDEYYALFTDMTQWVCSNAQKENIRFVLHVGDIVEHGRDKMEFELAAHTMSKLDRAENADGKKGIPWVVAYGNHEVIIPKGTKRPRHTLDPQAPAQSRNYRDYFGTTMSEDIPFSTKGQHRYKNHVGFGGVSKNDLNTWHTFKSSKAAGAREYLILNLEFDVPGGKKTTTGGKPKFDAIAWAQKVIKAHPKMPTIILTHVFEGTKHGPPKRAYYPIRKGRNSQLSIFKKLVKNNPQVFMVISGHTHEDTHQFKTNADGQQVLQMVTDYKSSDRKTGPAGGGFFRRIELNEQAGVIKVRTYSATADSDDNPKTKPYLADKESQFDWKVDWGKRFDGKK